MLHVLHAIKLVSGEQIKPSNFDAQYVTLPGQINIYFRTLYDHTKYNLEINNIDADLMIKIIGLIKSETQND